MYTLRCSEIFFFEFRQVIAGERCLYISGVVCKNFSDIGICLEVPQRALS